MAYASTNPYTGEVEKEFDYATDAEIDEVIETAHEAFKSWSRKTYAERGEYMRRAANLFRERAENIGKLVTREMGLPVSSSTYMAGEMVAEMLEYYADNAEGFLADEPLELRPDHGTAKLVYDPLGVIFAIEPWNAVVYQAVRPACGNLMVGNTVILKHASIVPQSAEAIEQVFTDAGLPKGVFTNVRATHDQTSRIIADDRVRGVTLTGSDAAGARVAEQAGKALKPSVLELGGNDAMIVLEDADIANALTCSMFRFTISGQACALPKRMFIHESIYDEFLTRYSEAIALSNIGDPSDPTTSIGPLSSKDAQTQLNDQIKRAVDGGATATPIGDPVPDHGWFVQPTIITNVTRDNPIFNEELFGPTPVLFKFSDVDEAIEMANDSSYGLGGSVYSEDLEKAEAIARRMDTGQVAINVPSNAYFDMPFGGTKRSGYGKEMGPQGIKEFALQKVILFQPTK